MARRLSILALFLSIATLPAKAQDAASIRNVMRGASAGVRTCAEQALSRGEQVDGRFVLEIRIARSGRVEHARVRGQSRSAFERCASRVLKRLRFPPMASSVTITYPLNVDRFD